MADSAAPNGASLGRCPGTETLRGFLDERLTTREHREVLAHVDGCAACDDALATLARSGSAAILRAAAPSAHDSIGRAFVERLAACQPPRRPLPRVAPEIPGVTGLEPVGRGGMGVVYRGHDTATGSTVAVKVMWSVGGLTEAAHARARAEAETLARIDDPGIVRVIRAGRCDGGPLEPDGVPFIVMEWIDGDTLQRRFGTHGLPVREAAAVIRDVGRVLARVHALGIVHRDIKPANVFLVPASHAGERATAKLVDFGLARRESDDGWSLGARDIAGTPGYMAPEQACTDGALGPVGPASDVHGLGATLFFLLTGRPPLDGRVDDVTLATTTTPRLDWHADGRPTVPVDLRTIVEKCLRSSPLRRYPSTGEVADDLDRFLSGLPIRARQASVGERLVTWSRRHPGWSVAAVSGILLLVITVAGSWLHTARVDHANRLANEARATAQAALAQLTGAWVQRMMTRGAALDGVDRVFLGEVRDLYRSWSDAADPCGALRFRAGGLGQIARIFTNLDDEAEASTLFTEALAAVDEYERRGGDADAVTTLRLELLRDDAMLSIRLLGGPRHGESVARYRALLDDPAATRARSVTERSIVLLGRLGLSAVSVGHSAASPPGDAVQSSAAEVEQVLGDLEALARANGADPVAATALVEGLSTAGTALASVTGPGVAIARLRQAEDRVVDALDRFGETPAHDRFRRLQLLVLANRCDVERASGAAADSLASARKLVALTNAAMESDETDDLFYRGEHVEAVIREALAAVALGTGTECIESLETAVDLAAESVAAQPAVFVHAGRLAKVLQCQSFVLEAVGRKNAAAAAARRVAGTIAPWRDSPLREAWAREVIAGAHARSGALRMEAGEAHDAIHDYEKLLSLGGPDARPQAARLLLAAGRAARRLDVVGTALAELLRHDARSRAGALRGLGITDPVAPAATPSAREHP